MHHGVQALVEAAENGDSLFPEFLDFSSFTNYLGCPRSWFFGQLMGMVPEESTPNTHLAFGKAWHRALEAGYLWLYHNGLPEDPYVLVEISKREMDVAWWQLQCDEYCDPPKTYQRGMNALEVYWTTQYNRLRSTAIEAVEQSFAIPLAPYYPVLYGTIDLVARDRMGLYVQEHKTTGSFAQKWQEGWDNSWQCEAYASAVRAIYGEIPRIVVSGTLFQKTHGPQVKRLPFTKNQEQLDRFHQELRYKLDGFLADLSRLTHEAAHGKLQSAFPRNPHHCQSYRLCQYYDWCCDDVRPYQREEPFAGMKWLPRCEKGVFAYIKKT